MQGVQRDPIKQLQWLQLVRCCDVESDHIFDGDFEKGDER